VGTTGGRPLVKRIDMNYWLMKSEPNTFSIDHLKKLSHQITPWDGVRNYQARNYLRAMKKNDLCFFYHSSCEVPGIVGIVEVVKEAYPEKDQPNPPTWYCVEVKLIQKFNAIISLSELKKIDKLKDMVLLRKGNRLSVMPIQQKEWETICRHLN
jgi:predicted RNA-binding protein with PUA-like domain